VTRAAVVVAGLVAWEAALAGLLGDGRPQPGLVSDAALLAPLTLVALLAGRRLGGRSRLVSAAVASLAFTVLAAALLGARAPAAAVVPRLCSTALAPAGPALPIGLVSALLLDVAFLPLALAAESVRRARLAPLFAAFVIACNAAAPASPPDAPLPQPDAPPPQPDAPLPQPDAPMSAGACGNGAPERTYAVSAIPVDMTLNRFGDHDPGASMYVLDDQIAAVRDAETRALPDRVAIGLGQDPVQPLVLRANAGECLVIHFTNRLAVKASMHVDGLAHTARDAGGAVGRNEDSFAAPGAAITYTLPLPTGARAERAYWLHDHGASRALVSHGLFGAIVVEPAGSTWRDPHSGAPLAAGAGWEAIIAPSAGPAFREFVLIYHEIGDETFVGILDAKGAPLPLVDDTSGTYRPASRAINYRSEPFRDRLLQRLDKSQAYGSYMFGDPATPIPRSYLGEPTKTRLLHGGGEVFHVHHQHGGGTRWRRNPGIEPSDFATGLSKVPVQDAKSLRLDAQTIGPSASFNLEHECGAGGCQQAAGDFLFHCHVQAHYLSGMWSFWRVFDTLQPDLAVLPDRAAPPTAVTSTGLLGVTVEGRTLVPRSQLTDPATQRALEDWIEAQLPPPGPRADAADATVWDWTKTDGPLYLGEPEDTQSWPNFKSDKPGERPPILFNPTNGRYAWPLLRPHLGMRPPFPGAGHTGAPWLGEDATAARADGLCPAGAATRRYPITSIATTIPRNGADLDFRGLLFVLGDDKAAVLAGARPKEPLVIRSNVGDCVDVLLTSEVPDSAFNGYHSKVNLHSHFIQYDPQGSDGVVTGLSFEQSVRPYATEARTLAADVPAGAAVVAVSQVGALRPGVWIGVGLGAGLCGATPCTEIRRITAVAGSQLTLDRPLELAHAAGEAAGVEFARYRWYSDVDSGTVFFHDHVTLHTWEHGLFGAHIVEPRGATWHDPETGAEVARGARVDVHVPAGTAIGAGASGDFRELVLFLHSASTDSQGTINLRAEPFAPRLAANPDPSLVFSSVTHGDPVTPILRAYVGDPVVVRGMGVTEVASGLRIAGHRFRLERFAAESSLTDTAVIGISERFDLVLDGGAGRAGDYLYESTLGRHLVTGAWGLVRVHDTMQPDLRPLPDRPAPAAGAGFPAQGVTGARPAAATDPGSPCPPGAPLRSYDVEIARAPIVYGPTQTDPAGIVYRLAGGAAASATEPLVLRAAAGECIEIALANQLDERAGLHAGRLRFDPQGSYGGAVGYNQDSTVAPGASRRYRFFADAELGTTLFVDLADPQTGARGAFGALVVEPVGATFGGGIATDVAAPTGSFRELVTLVADEDPTIGHLTMPYPRDVAGFASLSYAAARLADRGMASDASQVFASGPWGDPRLVFSAHSGDAVRLRIGAPWGEQLHQIAVEGHAWPLEPGLAGAEQVSSVAVAPGAAFDALVTAGEPADFLVVDERQPFTEAGLWGIFRVVPRGAPGPKPLPARSSVQRP
jgi:FtsP/CotA-like multicopper oxidase with cupredoxin domain